MQIMKTRTAHMSIPRLQESSEGLKRHVEKLEKRPYDPRRQSLVREDVRKVSFDLIRNYLVYTGPYNPQELREIVGTVERAYNCLAQTPFGQPTASSILGTLFDLERSKILPPEMKDSVTDCIKTFTDKESIKRYFAA